MRHVAQLKEYYQNGELHREGGPAVICTNETILYYQNGKLHREDGPATIYPHSSKREYWLDGKITPKKSSKSKYIKYIVFTPQL